MSAFKDHQLKYLKNWAKANENDRAEMRLCSKTILEIVARLEAAEAHMKACEEFHGFDSNDQPFVDAWLRASGKEKG